MAENSFSLRQKRGFGHFVLHVKRKRRVPEVMRLFSISIGGLSLILDKKLYY